MFLNEFWQPLILSERPYTIHDQHNGPLLLTSSAFKKRILYPENWNGIVMGSEAAIEEYHTLIREVEGSGHLQLFPLKENAPLVITEEKGYVEVTLLPAGKNEIGHDLHYFLLRNPYVKALITDELGRCLDFLPKSDSHFQLALREGMDIVYINDELYSLGENSLKTAEHEQIYALLQLIRPKKVCGLTAQKLPKCLLDLCQQKDLYQPTALAALGNIVI